MLTETVLRKWQFILIIALVSVSHICFFFSAAVVAIDRTHVASSLPSTSGAAAATSLCPVSQHSVAFPQSMEELLERQWEQGSHFLMSHAPFDSLSSLFSFCTGLPHIFYAMLLMMMKRNGGSFIINILEVFYWFPNERMKCFSNGI